MLYFNVEKEYPGFSLKAEFSVGEGEILCILGKSGSGKSTLLNLLSGTELPTKGIIKSNEQVFFDSENKINIPIHKRKIGYIAQKANLFPHLTVRENIFYGIKKKPYTKESLERFDYLLDAFSLRGQEDKKPSELSGGQQQRASIMRAIMYDPEMLLLDEPFSALDTNLRLGLRKIVLNLKDSLNIPMIFVTHDLEEAFFLCDKTIIIEDGEVVARGKKKDVFTNPQNLRQAVFVGISNIFKGEILSQNDGLGTVSFGGKVFDDIPCEEIQKEVYVGIRDTFLSSTDKNKDSFFDVLVKDINNYIDKKEIIGEIVGTDGEKITWNSSKFEEFKEGEVKRVYFNKADVNVFNR